MKKIIGIFTLSAIVLVAGMSVAYYNTKTFAFDENAVVFSKDDEKISFMDYDIYYKTIDNIAEKLKIIIPDRQFVI